MKSKTLVALAVAGSFACAGTFAGGDHHSASVHSQSSVEVQTPMSVNESAPWLAYESAHAASRATRETIGFQEGQFSDGPVGTNSGLSGTGSGGYDSSLPMNSSPESRSDSSLFENGDAFTRVEYWLLGDEPSGTGMSSSTGGSGSGGFNSRSPGSDTTSLRGSARDDHAFDSTAAWGEPLAYVSASSAEGMAEGSAEATSLSSQHYLVYGPLVSFSGQDVIVLELGPASEDIALLDALSRDFYVLTPVYDES